MEKLWYETKPMVYLFIGLFGIIGPKHSMFSQFAGLVLIFCAGMIAYWRVQARGQTH